MKIGKNKFLIFLTRIKNKNTFKHNSKLIKNIFGNTGWADTRNEKSGNVKASMYAFCLVECTNARMIIRRMGSIKYIGKFNKCEMLGTK